jgi:hypothetical protein
MGLIDDASFAFTAALGASKPGTAYSLKPTDGSGDFAFARADDPNDGGLDLAATFINQQGYIEKGYENAILGSNDFALDNSSYTITSGEEGYDGTTDAWLVNKLVTSGAYFGKSGVVYTGVMTISFYAKAGTLDRIFLFTAGEAARFDLDNVTAAKTGGTPIAQTIELVSGTTDWYRCSITINKNETNNILLKPQDSSNQDAAGTIYIQDAMLNEGLAAMPYIESGASKAQKGLVQDEPRFTFSNGTRSLLLEPERTNLTTRSEYFDVGPSVKDYSTIQVNGTTSPSGLDDACLFTETIGYPYSRHGFYQYTTISAGALTASIFTKEIGRRYIHFQSDATGAVQSSYVDLQDGSVVSEGIGWSLSTENYGNGWYRIKASCTAVAGFKYFIWGVSQNGTSHTYQGNTSVDFTFYGFQLEEGSSATSYIPTNGTTKTRLKDDLTSTLLPIDGLFGPTAGTIFLEFANPLENVSNNWFFVTSLLADGRYMRVRNYWQFNFTDLTFDPSPNLSRTDGATKIAVKWGDGVVKVFTDHRSPESATYTGGDINLNGHLSNLNGDFGFYKNNANFKKIMFFRTALSDDECIELTTL